MLVKVLYEHTVTDLRLLTRGANKNATPFSGIAEGRSMNGCIMAMQLTRC